MLMNATAGLVDFHCHLDLYPDHQAAVREAEEAGVYTLTVTTTPQAWPRNHEIAQCTRHVRAALGLHPQLVAERASEIELWERYLPETRYVGEVGLDAGPRFYKSFELQKEVFRRILQCCAEAGDKIISVHSARSAKAVLDYIERYLPPPRGKVVLHWFTGSKAEVRRAIELGCYFSVNTAMLENERHASTVALIPLDRLLTETDGPFTKIGDRIPKPSDVTGLVERLSRLYGISTVLMTATIRENLRILLASKEGLNH
jgi:TatD DNase family protein